MKISVLYEDDDVVVINKTAGLVVHPDGKTVERAVTDWVRRRYKSIGSVGEPLKLSSGKTVERPGIVHRLDRETSGVLLIVKTKAAYRHFKKQFQNREVRKTYNAFVYGAVKKETGTISIPIGRNPHDFRQREVGAKARGEARNAVTHYVVLKRGNDVSFLKLVPKTGRTHQIRVHLKSIGHPVVCDKLYAPSRPCLLGFKRLALHAQSLVFTTRSGREINVEAPFPADFSAALRKLR